MGKVIDMWTRKEITQMPATKEEGEALIEHLIRFELKNPDPFSTELELVNNLIFMVENNTGASRYEVMDRIHSQSRSV